MKFHKNFPYGKGLWIWEIKSCFAGDIDVIIKQCLSYKVSYVIVKAGDGPNTWAQFTRELVEAFHKAGIKIYSWSYVYGENPLREAAIAMWALDMGVDGHVFDAESEYENKPQQAITMLHAVREHSPNAFLAYAPFPIIDYHQKYPYIEFGKYCDAVMPQIYWGDFKMTPTEALNWTYRQFNKWESVWEGEGHGDSVKPMIPLGQSYDNPQVGYKTTPQDIAEFIKAVAGYYSVNFWSFQHILSEPIWAAIRDNNVKEKPKAEEIPEVSNGSASPDKPNDVPPPIDTPPIQVPTLPKSDKEVVIPRKHIDYFVEFVKMFLAYLKGL